MSKVTVLPDLIEFEADSGQTIMESAHARGLYWPTTCGGQGLCTTCLSEVVEGGQNLLEMGRTERKTLVAERGEAILRKPVRLACQHRPEAPSADRDPPWRRQAAESGGAVATGRPEQTGSPRQPGLTDSACRNGCRATTRAHRTRPTPGPPHQARRTSADPPPRPDCRRDVAPTGRNHRQPTGRRAAPAVEGQPRAAAAGCGEGAEAVEPAAWRAW